MSQYNFKNWILETIAGAPIEAVVIGRMGWSGASDDVADDYNCEYVPNYVDMPKGTVLSWDEASEWLDFAVETGFGAPTCPAIYIYTATNIFFVVQYDGSVSLYSLPRNPTAELPIMPGG